MIKIRGDRVEVEKLKKSSLRKEHLKFTLCFLLNKKSLGAIKKFFLVTLKEKIILHLLRSNLEFLVQN